MLAETTLASSRDLPGREENEGGHFAADLRFKNTRFTHPYCLPVRVSERAGGLFRGFPRRLQARRRRLRLEFTTFPHVTRSFVISLPSPDFQRNSKRRNMSRTSCRVRIVYEEI